jgi:hypothetical protein
MKENNIPHATKYWTRDTKMVPINFCSEIKRCSCFKYFLLDFFFLNLHSGGWSPNWVHSARRPLVCMYVYSRGGPHTALAPRPSLIYCAYLGHLLAYCTCPGWLWGWRIWWNEWQGKPKYSEKTCHDATLSTTNPTWPDPGLSPGRRGGKPETNRFSYGAASF